MATMEKEYFWGCELSKDKKEYNWDSEDEQLSKADIEQKLILSRACLGVKAKLNDRNVVEVTTTDISENPVTYTILSLQSGKKEQCRLSLGFPSSVVFKLVEGSGPVHLTGSLYQELHLDEDDLEDDSDEEEKPSNILESDTKLASKKRPLASETPKGPPKKLARVEDEEDDDESDDDEEDEDEEESSEETGKMEVDTKQKQKKQDTVKTEDKSTKKQKAKEDSEEDEESGEEESDEDDEEEEEESDEEGSDEEESEDDEDDDEEDESEEEDEITASLTAKKKGGKADVKKPMTNGVAKPNKKPAAEEKGKPNKAQAKQQPATPKTGGKKDDAKKASPKTPQPMDIEQIKERLKKTPTLPKKVDKFKNYMRSSFKITDDTVVTKLWDWLKENK